MNLCFKGLFFKLYVWVCVHVRACALECRCSPRLEEGIGSLIDGITSSCELPGVSGEP